MIDEPIMTPADRNRVEAAASALIEHFDSVRIFVTKHDGEKDATGSFTSGKGNFFAQQGQIAEWMLIQSGEAHLGFADGPEDTE